MRHVIVKAFGGPEQLTLESTDEAPQPGPGQVLVEVEAAGVNYIDVMHRKGIAKVPLPYTPGLEGVGRGTKLGEGAADLLAVGQPQCARVVRGTGRRAGRPGDQGPRLVHDCTG